MFIAFAVPLNLRHNHLNPSLRHNKLQEITLRAGDVHPTGYNVVAVADGRGRAGIGSAHFWEGTHVLKHYRFLPAALRGATAARLPEYRHV